MRRHIAKACLCGYIAVYCFLPVGTVLIGIVSANPAPAIYRYIRKLRISEGDTS